jgi:hypothetical protein
MSRELQKNLMTLIDLKNFINALYEANPPISPDANVFVVSNREGHRTSKIKLQVIDQDVHITAAD